MRITRPVVIAVGLVITLSSGGYALHAWLTRPSLDADDDPTLLVVDRDGGRVNRDERLPTMMDGNLTPSDDTVTAAMCFAAFEWVTNRMLNTNVVIATDPALVRAAELYTEAIEDHHRDEADLIVDIEGAFWRLGSVARLEDWAADLGDEDRGPEIREYLAARRDPPSASAADRFVVYVGNFTTSVQQVIYLDTARLMPSTIEAPARRGFPEEPLVAGEDEPRSMSLSDCDDLADRWDRYDPDLPPLPPITDRWYRVDDTVPVAV